MHTRSLPAVTLLEMSVVVSIIGLIIGGIMMGATLADRARKQSMISDLQKYDQAVANFNSKFLGFPGDITNASSIFTSGCNATACNGNGNNVIEFISAGSGETWIESNEAWEHLSLSQLVTPYMRYTTPPTPGSNVPTSATPGTSYWLVNQMQIFVGSPRGGVNNYLDGGAFAPADVRYFDDKLDDDQPGTGIIQARINQSTPTTTTTCINQQYNAATATLAGATYVMTDKSPSCFMIYVTTSGTGQATVTYGAH